MLRIVNRCENGWVMKSTAVTTLKPSRIGSYRCQWSKPSWMGWVSSYRRRLAFVSSTMILFLLIGIKDWNRREWVGFLLIGDTWVSSHWRRLAFFSSAMISFGIGDTWVLIVTLGSTNLGGGLVERVNRICLGVFFLFGYCFFDRKL